MPVLTIDAEGQVHGVMAAGALGVGAGIAVTIDVAEAAPETAVLAGESTVEFDAFTV